MPHQHVAPIVRSMCMGNRTRAAMGNRDETKELREIEMEVLNDYTKQMKDTDRAALDLVRTGSTWHKTAAFWAGHCDSRLCELCGQEDERSDHFWRCTALSEKRTQVDAALAEIDPEVLPPAVRHGIPPVLSAGITGTYWNQDPEGQKKQMYDALPPRQKEMLGVDTTAKLPIWVQDQMMGIQPRVTAKQQMQKSIGNQSCGCLPLPKRAEGCLPRDPNCFADGSMQQPQRRYLHLGSFGVWWPGRDENCEPRN